MVNGHGTNGSAPWDTEKWAEETWPDSRATPRSFYGAPLCDNLDQLAADIAFLGVPFDQGTGTPGARFGPDGIRDSRTYSYSGINGLSAGPADASGYYDIDQDRDLLAGVTMADCGNVAIVPSDVDRNFWRITRAVRKLVRSGSLPIIVGGDHAITPAIVRGFDSYTELDIVHLDAHLDFNDHTQGIRWTNGNPIRRSSEFPWVKQITQIGMRASRSRGPVDDARANGNRLITTDQLMAMGPEAAAAMVPASKAIYVTFDIDIMDPSICPGTGAPEPGGPSYFDMRALLRALTKRGPIVGMDLVEVAPSLDATGLTSKTAARLLLDFLVAIFDVRKPAGAPAAAATA